ncbi:putative periplasmic ligand-binding sensor protein [Nitrobacter hamburgensis X14]|uniref:Putative periplasmic ligand-binding sensor protein n=1 Tax=Nitrobacter hamburgensis (strain DSM 10229 / NCIMB 13809 / X14) TaxID=323097 RepID=Q1QIM1_NITHX|nr:DUF2076 domain-containing protein [Nitrobacter hamburgensis]ABE63926.1 putative periplasmic ligand-binding sensor protein [Nitrobacter hamburgensis X14]
MTPQERQLVDDLFTRLAGVENAPRDPAAAAVIADGLRRAPNALYTLVQTVLVQDEALKRAHDRIQELESGGATDRAASGGFLDQMRDTLFGKPPQRGSVPNVQPPPMPSSRPAWNTGQVLQQAEQPGRYNQGAYEQRPAGQPPAGQPTGMPQAGGGSFLGTAAAAAAGAVGGGLLLSSIRSMMGGEAHASSLGGSGGLGGSGSSPWGGAGDQSGSSLARDAGVKDVGSQPGNTPQTSPFDQTQADADQDQDQDQDDDDNDEMDMDSDDFDDGGGDY